MIPVRLSLRNFLSYGEEVPPLDFTPLHVVCLSGDNGHGKSALLDAMTWAVWGEARKAAGARKPDDDLLRKGAGEMAVEFEFDVQTETHRDRYRVLRQYRPTRGGKSALEFQIYSPESEGFHSLTQPSLTATQRLIEQTLRMAYDTFINSVFIVQGRADEFTRRSASDRKKILADILGLWLYEELEERSRQRAVSARRTAAERGRRLSDIDTALKEEPACRKRIETLEADLKRLTTKGKRIDKERDGLRVRLATTDTARKRLDDLRKQRQNRLRRLSDMDVQIASERAEIEEFVHTLSERAVIEQTFLEYRALTEERERLNRSLQRLRRLEGRKNEIDTKILQARHGREVEKQKWIARRESLEKGLTEAQALLGKKNRIEEGYQRLLLARRADEQWDKKRRRYDEIDLRMRECRETLRQDESALQTELSSLRHRLGDLDRRVSGIESHRTRVAALKEQDEDLRRKEQEKQKIEERGRELVAHIDMQKNKIKLYKHQEEEANDRLKELLQKTKANCPLCDAALDERRRETIEANIGDTLQAHAVEIDKSLRSIQLAEEEKKELTVKFKTIRPQLEALPQLQQEIATADRALQDAIAAAAEARGPRRDVEALQNRLERGDYGKEARREIETGQATLKTLGYDPDRHEALKTKLRELQTFESEKSRLEETQARYDTAVAEREKVMEHISNMDRELETETYAEAFRAELENVECDMEALRYDETNSQCCERRFEELKDAPSQKEKLDEAIRQHDKTRMMLADRLQVAEALRTELDGLTAQIETLERESEDTTETEQLIEELSKLRETVAQEERETNQQVGAEKEKATRYRQMAEERPSVETDLRQAARDQQVYEKLTVAFSRDGIPALIIENAIPEIEEEANAILSRLTDNRTQITIEPLRNLKTGGSKETLDIQISDELGTRPYELFSGGEAFRTNFALRIALSKLLARRAGASLRTLIIDEGFGTQDAEGLDHLVDALQGIQEDFEKIIVVTHLERLKNAFPSRIEVAKYPDIGSRFEVVV
ncbi:MAG: AAA family ATPase [candidate division Zixibacteria bacterium]|nr:AAA family ATPase [candidate division Zixibacteria bacterium]